MWLVGGKESRETKILSYATRRMEMSSAEMGKVVNGAYLDVRIKGSVWRC